MDLILLVLVLCIVGFIVWLLTTRIPMDPMVKNAIQLIAAIVIILYALGRLGVIPNLL